MRLGLGHSTINHYFYLIDNHFTTAELIHMLELFILTCLRNDLNVFKVFDMSINSTVILCLRLAIAECPAIINNITSRKNSRFSKKKHSHFKTSFNTHL